VQAWLEYQTYNYNCVNYKIIVGYDTVIDIGGISNKNEAPIALPRASGYFAMRNHECVIRDSLEREIRSASPVLSPTRCEMRILT